MSAEAAAIRPGQLDLGVLYREHHADVFRFILRRCGGQVDLAQDLAHNTWLKFFKWTCTHTWVDRGRPVLSMLYRTAYSVLCDWWKSSRLHPVPSGDLGCTELGLSDWCDPQEEAVASAQQREWRGVLKEVIAALPLRQRQVLHLRYVEGLTQREIGIKLDMTEGAVKGTNHRAMKALRANPRVQELDGELD